MKNVEAIQGWVDGTMMQRRINREKAAAAKKSPELALRRAARRAAGVSRSFDVQIVDGDVAPHVEGEGGGYCNSSHPTGSGYERSTLRVVVGRDWTAQ